MELVLNERAGEVRDAEGEVVARVAARNLLAGFDGADMLDGCPLIAWSGSFAEINGGGLFDEDPRTWGRVGWQALESALDRTKPANTIVIRPHARHVISDVPSVLRLARTRPERIGVLLDPGSMLTEEMRSARSIGDHLARLCELARELHETDRLFGVVEDPDFAGEKGPISLPDGARSVRVESRC